jgi:pilus assembly protein CpaF
MATLLDSAGAPPLSEEKKKKAGLPFKAYQELKSSVHRELLNRVDLEKVATLRDGRIRGQVFAIIQDLIANLNAPMSGPERERLAREVLDEVFGLGPIEPLLQDPTINDILVNTHKHVYVERAGMLEETNVMFKDDAHLMHIIEKIVAAVGRRVDESSPMVDARLPDGSRVNVIIPPLAIDGPALSVRRFGHVPLTADDLLTNRTLTPPMLELLRGAVKARLSIVISGGTGAGKTTFLNVLSGYISDRERIVINSLRMRPDRIIVGEVRGEEALDMLQAMNTGHDGSLTTVHANTPRDAIARLETMALMANLNLPEKAIRQQIASAVAIVVQVSRMSDGTRRVTHLTEITGMDDEVLSMQDIFVFERQGIASNGRVVGTFSATGIRPKFAEKLKASGIAVPAAMFEHTVQV